MIRHPALVALAICAALPAGAQGFTPDAPAPAVIAADAGDLYDAGVIVVLAPDAAAADRLVTNSGYVLMRRDRLAALGLELIVLRLPPGRTGSAAIAELEALEPGVTAGVDHAYRGEPAAVPAPGPGRTYADAALGWPATGCPAQVAVGIIDTDLSPEVPALAGVAIERQEFVDDPGGRNHGTAVAELLAGPGRLTQVRLVHAAVVGRDGSGSPAAGVDALVRALDWLQVRDVRLVNVSLAGPYNKILDRAVQAAAARGMVVVAAAGNTGPDGPPRYPAAFRQTIAVTAIDVALAPYDQAPEGVQIDIAAPGVDVRMPDGRYLSGTSIAAPFVTAAIAADPEAAHLDSVAAIRDWLGREATDLGAPGPDPVFGAGLVQAGAACRGLRKP